jgi:hypothetical protein
VSVQLNALLPAFRGSGNRVGELDMAALQAWAKWEARFGIVRRPPNVAFVFDPNFAANVPSPAAAG